VLQSIQNCRWIEKSQKKELEGEMGTEESVELVAAGGG
jgi:hypothetical protein